MNIVFIWINFIIIFILLVVIVLLMLKKTRPLSYKELDDLHRSIKKDRGNMEYIISNIKTDIIDLLKTIEMMCINNKEKDDTIKRKNQQLKNLENILIYNENVIDFDTNLYNKYYYDTYIKNSLNDNFYVLTITIIDMDLNQDRLWRREIANTIKRFCADLEMIPVLWENNTIKIFIHVNENKISNLRETMERILHDKYTYKKLYLDFRRCQ